MSKIIFISVAIWAAVSGGVPVSAQDPVCQLPVDFFSYTDAVNCINSVPFSETIRDTTIDSLRKSVPIFAFAYPAANIPSTAAGLTIQPTDLIAGLEAIQQKSSYTTDIAFQNDLVALYNQLCDAHSLYFRPANYAALTFWQAFSMVSIQGGVQISIAPFFPPGLEAAYLRLTGINITQYAGSVVTQINGQSATDFITAYAKDHVGLSKDLATRFNVALTRFEPTPDKLSMTSGSFQKRRGLYFTMPLDSSYITYTLNVPGNPMPVTIEMPWIAASSTAFNGTQSFMNMYYANGGGPSAMDIANGGAVEPKSIPSKQTDETTTKKDTKLARDIHFPESERSYFTRSVVPEDAGFTLIIEYQDMTFWKHPDGVTLVMYLSTFEPNNVTAYMQTLVAGVERGKAMGLTRFIMDFTDNGGGDICFGIAVLAYLFGGDGDTGFSPTDMPATPFTLELARRAAADNINDTIWSAWSYMSYPAFYPWVNTNQSWMIPPVNRPRGSGTLQFSQMLDLSLPACAGYDVVIPGQNPFPSDQMLIVTRGFCGSTCALVSGHSHLFHEVPAVTLGGLATQPQQQIFSFPGLQVVDSPDFYTEWIELGFNVTYDAGGASPDELCPRQLGTSAGFRYCIREIYPPYEVMNGWPVPLEYVFTPSDFHLYFDANSVLHSEYIWLQATKFFPPSSPVPTRS